MKACRGPTVTTEIPGRQSASELALEPLAGLYLKLTKCWRVLFGDALPTGKGSHGLRAWGCLGLVWTGPWPGLRLPPTVSVLQATPHPSRGGRGH